MRLGWIGWGGSAILGLLLAASIVAAQQAAPAPAADTSATAYASEWPTYESPAGGDEHSIKRGPGFYLHSVKLLLVVLLFLAWARTTQWVSEDCEATTCRT